MNKINVNYNEFRIRKSDINEHLPTLKQYAEKCETVCEMGVREVVSTWAFLAANPKKLTCYDLYLTAGVREAEKLAKENGIDFKFIQSDVLKVKIDKTDLLFIDTFHCYNQLNSELNLHAKNAKKYIILHDTVSYAHTDEKGHWVTPEMIANYEYKGKEGLIPAIEEFLKENTEWIIERHFLNNNGLMVLRRVYEKA